MRAFPTNSPGRTPCTRARTVPLFLEFSTKGNFQLHPNAGGAVSSAGRSQGLARGAYLSLEGAKTPEFLAVNPNGRLPAVDDDGFVLWESLAITLYLTKKHSTGRLYPATLEGEAKTWQWSLWALNEVDRGVNIWSLHAVRLPPEDRDPEKLAEALKVIAAPFKVYRLGASL